MEASAYAMAKYARPFACELNKVNGAEKVLLDRLANTLSMMEDGLLTERDAFEHVEIFIHSYNITTAS